MKTLSGAGELAASGNVLLALLVALAAGVLSFISPCVLPLVPGYLAYVSGITSQRSRGDRPRVALGVLLFIAGFSTVYVGLTLVFSLAGLYLIPWLGLITRIAGLLVFAMGLVFIGQLTFLQKVIKPSWTVATGLGGAPLLGVFFALGWAPCSAPTLSVVLSLSLGSASPTRGVILGIAYCLGIGIPFLLAALGLDWMANSITWVKRNIRTINVVGGVALMVIGLVMIAGIWQLLMSRLGSLLPGFVSPI